MDTPKDTAKEPMKHLSSDDLDNVWSVMANEKSEVVERAELFARWTLPYVCPEDTVSADADQRKSYVYNGAKYVSHLANRIVDTMFPSDRPFFAITLNADSELELGKELEEEEQAEFKAMLRKATALIEKSAMRKMALTTYRPVAVQAAEHTIVTGNAAILRMDDDKRVVYGIKDYCVRREINGDLCHAVLRDSKKFGSLSTELQDAVKSHKPALVADNETDVMLYTYFWRENGKWTRVQGIENYTLPDSKKSYNDEDFPLIALTWSLSRGDNYGRGLVELHESLFDQLDVLTEAGVDLVGIAADVKFLVNPSSGVDVEEWNNALRGAYVPGREGDITVPEFRGRDELEVIRQMVMDLNRELGMIFLSGSAATRDAERVTAEEIRYNARELNTAFGGIYSKLAVAWQQREADYVIAQLDRKLFDSLKDFDVVVTTGVESLSREGQLDDFARAMTDLQLMDAIPEDIRGELDLRRIAEFIFTNRGASFSDFVLSTEKKQARQQAAEQAQQQALAAEGQQQVAVEAGKQAAQQE